MARATQISLGVCILVSVILIGGVAFAQRPDTLRRIVKFRGLDLKTPGGLATARSVVAGSKSNEVHLLWLINAMAIQLPTVSADQALASLQRNPNVEEVFNDPLSVAAGAICIDPAPPPVPESYPWGLQMIDVPAVHQRWPGLWGAGVTVAILDTGIDWSHPELSPRIGGGYNARAGGGSSADDNGHGTHMAGIIAGAINGLGISGVAPQAAFLAVKVLDQYGAGYLSDVVNGLQWVYNYNNGSPLVINMSLGFSTDSPPLQQAIQSLYASGVIMVASAGNRCAQSPGQDEGGGDCQGGPALVCDPSQTAVKYPAAYDSWVLAVAATDFYDDITAYSLTGSQVDVAAPGGSKATGIRILSTTKGSCAGGCYGEGSGTSQAAAHVTGAVALALQLDPGLPFEEVRSVLQTTAVDLRYPATQQGAGRINVKKMVQALQ
jgi:subtilisin family serine protease